MTIPRSKLLAVHTIVTHEGCPDGIASAMILRHAIPGVRVFFMRHGSPELTAMRAELGMLFCDFTPPPDRVEEFRAAGTLVLDHHKTARSVVEAFGDDGVFGDEVTEPGVCGAMLAFREVWEPIFDGSSVSEHKRSNVEQFATLAGIRDTWQRSDKRWEQACAQAAALTFWPVDQLLAAFVSEWPSLLAIGPTLLARRAEVTARAIRDAQRIHVAGRRIVIIPTTDTSDVMDALEGEAEIVAGFGYRCDTGTPRMTVSLRGRGVDVAALARQHGGGGHTAAAGFTIDVFPGDGEPYGTIRGMISEWLTKGAS